MPDALTRLRDLLDAARRGPVCVASVLNATTGRRHYEVEARVPGNLRLCPGQHPIMASCDNEADARAIAAWMNLRGEVMALVEAVADMPGALVVDAPLSPSCACCAICDEDVPGSECENPECPDKVLDAAYRALLAAIEREVGDA